MTLRASIQLLLLIIGVAFESVRMGHGWREMFPLINLLEIPRSEYFGNSENFRNYVYYLCEHFIYIVMAWMIWDNSQTERDVKTDRFFIILALADALDYILWGNNFWFHKELIPHNGGFGLVVFMSMNLVMVICFGIYSHRQWKISNGNQ